MTAAPELATTGEAALILAAERLFAERGIEAVALRQVNQAANQKNMSAAHYHFGSRDGLVEAVLKYRLSRLDVRRRELLARGGAVRDVRFYLEAFIAPLAEELRPRPEGNHYLRFVREYARYRGEFDFARHVSPAGVTIYDALEGLVSYLPPAVARLRMGYLINMIHAILATAEEGLATGAVPPAEIDLIVANAIDMVASALSAPLSAQTMDALGCG